MAETSAATSDLVVPTPDDFRGIAELHVLAFEEKNGCESKEEALQGALKAYNTYQAKHPQKLQHCRILKDSDSGTVMAACQLQVQGDVGDLQFPSGMQHKLSPNEVYIEWIACHPDHTGKGLGSQLLFWATEFATHTARAQVLSLQVMKANQGAVRLYQRKGFVIQPPNHKDPLDAFLSGLFVFFCLGCKYWTVLYMEKPLQKPSDQQRQEQEEGGE